MVLVAVPVFDILCSSTDHLLERRLAKLDGVVRVSVNAANDTVYAELDPARCDADALIGFLHRQGFRTGAPRRLSAAEQPAGPASTPGVQA